MTSDNAAIMADDRELGVAHMAMAEIVHPVLSPDEFALFSRFARQRQVAAGAPGHPPVGRQRRGLDDQPPRAVGSERIDRGPRGAGGKRVFRTLLCVNFTSR